MRLKGEVEVFKILQDGSSESVIKENNMVVDGASEIIVDMFTTPYSVKNTAGSASLDPSNFIVQGLSLGKAQILYGGSIGMSGADTDQIGMHAVYNNKSFSGVYVPTEGELLGDEWIGGLGPGETVSSFKPSIQLPKEPFPRDNTLERSSKTQVAFYYENSAIALSSYADASTTTYNPTSGTLLEELGHNLNAFYSRAENKTMASMHQGCYAPSDGMDLRVFFGTNAVRSQVEANGGAGPGLLLEDTVTSAADVSGRYNYMGSMDKNGFLVGYPVQDHPASGDLTRGFAVSAGATNSLAYLGYNATGGVEPSTSFLESPTVCYSFTISSADLQALAAYKGVTNIGLWALDAKETFKSEAAPVVWTTPTNNRKYKLFAKKIFSEDLTSIRDSGTDAGLLNYVNLDILWRMNFSFGETF
jgi:hypothetical protein